MADPPRDWSPYLGRKLSLRYRLRGESHPFSEAVGVLMAIESESPSHLKIVGREGKIIRVRIEDVLAAKIYPA
jgi:hypothetical protein